MTNSKANNDATANLYNKRRFKNPTKTLLITLLMSAILGGATGCDDDDDNNNVVNNATKFEPINLSIAHINDHHSHLEPEGTQTFMLDGTTYRSERGGFARIKTVYDELEGMYADKNFLKLHAGDAITGTSYFSYYDGDADADMMNTICFDAFALGNHEFDASDAGLKRFLDRLNGTDNNPNNCQTPVLAANVKPKVGTPLAPSNVDDYIKPYIIKTTNEGVKVGIIGIDIEGKTKNSSRPLETTEFLNETTTAQNYINELQNKGIEHIVLLTHYTYNNDKALAAALSGVDVIIGGDSHTLLGDFSAYSTTGDATTFGSQGLYPTVITNKDGDTVCIGQSWEYTKAVGIMNIAFDDKGKVTDCAGSQIIPIADSVTRYNEANNDFETISDSENQAVIDKLNGTKSELLTKDLILPFKQDTDAAALLDTYTQQIAEKLKQVIGKANEPLCLVRVPGTSRSTNIAGCEDTAKYARGSDIAQVVAKSFLDVAKRADFAIQNAGGVRDTVLAGDVTYGTAKIILPFNNVLVNMDITGSEVKQSLEEAVTNHMDKDGSDGSHPYAAGLRWDLDLSKDQGNRFSNIEIQDRNTGEWSPLDMDKTYVMVTNDFIAEGRDGYVTFGKIFKDTTKVEDTKLLYTQSFIDYIDKVGTLKRPDRSDYSHKSVILADGMPLMP